MGRKSSEGIVVRVLQDSNKYVATLILWKLYFKILKVRAIKYDFSLSFKKSPWYI